MPSHRELDLFAPTPEHALFAETLESFVAREVEPQAAEHDRDETFNHALFRRAGELGLLGVTLPEEYGGAGLDAVAAVQVCEVLSTSDPGFALAVLAHAVLFAQNVNVNGSDVQRKRVLPKAASGDWIGGMCMTEPGVGTDVLAMATRARRDGDGYVIDGTKTFITNGGVDERTVGDAFVVYARTGEREISAFLVERGELRARVGLLVELGELARAVALEEVLDLILHGVGGRAGERPREARARNCEHDLRAERRRLHRDRVGDSEVIERRAVIGL